MGEKRTSLFLYPLIASILTQLICAPLFPLPHAQLRDAFFSDYRGRKVTVSAPSRRVAACALRTLLFQLSASDGNTTTLTSSSSWNYIDRKGVAHGPYPFTKMLKWAQKNAFNDESLPVQHASLKCWVPLWLLVELAELGNGTTAALDEPEDMDMEDWELTVRELNEARSERGMLHDVATAAVMLTGAAPGKASSLGESLADFPELQVGTEDDDAAPMDYELSQAIKIDVAPDSVRAFVVVDTNILLSHLTFTERVFQSLASAAPSLEVLLLVPWVVLNELDRLKDASSQSRAAAARLALRRLRALTAERDSFVHTQSAAEHARVVAAGELSASSQLHRELRNDDLILQTCLHWHRGAVAGLRAAGHRAAVFLLSNDRGLCARAEANGVKCFAAMEFPGTARTLASQVPPTQGVAMAMHEGAAAGPGGVSLPTPGADILTGSKVHVQDTHLSSSGGAYQVSLPGPVQPIGGLPLQTLAHSQQLPGSIATSPHPSTITSSQISPREISDLSSSPRPALSLDPGDRLASTVERCLAPGIKYYRQQDLGDLWIEMLEESSRPPWTAPIVLDVLVSHSTTFWDVLSRSELDQAKQLERYLKARGHGHGHGHGHGYRLAGGPDATSAATTLLAILSGLLRGLDRPRQDGNAPPDPSEVPDFVSLGEARAALQEGVAEVQQLVADCTGTARV